MVRILLIAIGVIIVIVLGITFYERLLYTAPTTTDPGNPFGGTSGTNGQSSTGTVSGSDTSGTSETSSGSGTTASTTGTTGTTVKSYPSTPKPSESPTQLATDFYGWYLNGLKADIHFTQESAFTSYLSSWLTPDFVQNWSAIGDSKEQDPFLLAQDYATSWPGNISAVVSSQTGSTATVIVSLGTGTEMRRLSVNEVLQSGKWLIASVSRAS